MENVFISSEGQGNPVVLIHGFCEDRRIWQPVATALAKNHRVLLADLPGFGQTPLAAGQGPETIENMADRIAHTLKSEGIEKATIIGHSLGGYVTLALAERHPQMLNGFGLFHSTAYADTDEKKQAREKQAEFVKNNGAGPFVKTLIPALFAQNHPHATQLEYALNIGKECGEEGIINALHAMRLRPERLAVLQQARVPVLIIAGVEDGVVPVEKLSYQASLPVRCQFELFEKSGHMGQLEEPQKSIEVINGFMEFVHQN